MDENIARSEAMAKLSRLNGKPRRLVREPVKMCGNDTENCVICEAQTRNWLQPENAPLCGAKCLKKYLADPSVYDPFELYGPAPKPVERPKDKTIVSVVKAFIVTGCGPDRVSLELDLPSSFAHYAKTDGKLHVKFEADARSGVEFVKKHFGIESNQIDVVRTTERFS